MVERKRIEKTRKKADMVVKLSIKQKKQKSGNGDDPNPKLAAGLYLVATPIGNIKDITLRALETLKAADMILCEDTRVSGSFLKIYDIKKPLQSLHDHNEAEKSDYIISEIKKGKAIALISDAGMPLISDPGYKLVTACLDNEVMVTSCPGASAPLTALQLSGLPSDKFAFLGFLPTKSKARQTLFETWKTCPATLIFFENALRVKETLIDIQNIMSDKQIVIARELTKLFEEIWRGTADELIAHIESGAILKGEIVLLINGAQTESTPQAFDIEQLLKKALINNSLKDAVMIVTEQTGHKKKDVYAKALDIQGTLKNEE